MTTDLAGLVERYRLSEAASIQFAALARLLTDDPRAPTAIRDPTRVVEDHLADSLVALECPELHAGRQLVDIGAGAGLPGLALAIARPELRVVLLESSRRKCAFIERAIAHCGLSNATVVTARAESWPAGRAAFDVATARAVGRLDVVAEYAAPLMRVGAVLVAWRGARDPEAEAQGQKAAEALGLRVLPPRPVRPFPAARHRYLHLMSKVTDTPARFPRRPGVALKRPLGGPALARSGGGRV